MTTLDGVAKKQQVEQSAEQQAAVELVRLAREQGFVVDRARRAAQAADQTVLETALNEEMAEHLGSTRVKTMLTDTTGAVEIDVPRDRAATFEP